MLAANAVRQICPHRHPQLSRLFPVHQFFLVSLLEEIKNSPICSLTSLVTASVAQFESVLTLIQFIVENHLLMKVAEIQIATE